mmetsp:Transcript_19585/g.23994  ORF Transcript_19585/g.23994 Transcript_19585/m.23994 type:complete len:412 (-) Transcript_19585:152-1387(-)
MQASNNNKDIIPSLSQSAESKDIITSTQLPTRCKPRILSLLLVLVLFIILLKTLTDTELNPEPTTTDTKYEGESTSSDISLITTDSNVEESLEEIPLLLPLNQEKTKTAINIADSPNIDESIFASPFIVWTEGGCSGTTMIGKYITKIIAAHGIHHLPIEFEFLHGDEKNPRTNEYKNKYFHTIVKKKKLTAKQIKRQYDDIMIESIQRAQADAKKSSSVMFFKAKIKKYKKLRKRFDRDLDRVSYAGVYRGNVLDRCICMVRDCFYEARNDGKPVFAVNGTETDLCFNRRFHPEISVEAKFTDVIGCLKGDQGKIDFINKQRFTSFSSEDLFQFENSLDDDAFHSSVNDWMVFLKPLMKKTLDWSLVASVLEEGRGTRTNTSSQASKVYRYDKIKHKLMGTDRWEVFLHD